jgi:hypothetical protein
MPDDQNTSLKDTKAVDDLPENLRAVYQQLCESYRAIDDFRTKLLGFLPLATATGMFFLITEEEKIAFLSSIFGTSASLGL